MSVRVRFAPSPTGWLHVGGARTAYFNWLFARQHGGSFVIRIEDTDVERSSAASEAGVLADLGWLGLEYDEGPDRDGPYGPYRQSERHLRGVYRERAERLLASGAAYPCFCTDAELEERRRAALAAGRPPHYDGRCRRLTPAERDARRSEGRLESVRFAVDSREWVLNDRVRGEVRFPPGMVGDFVLLRSNGLPTYNFAAAVDDAAMRISHVIRAEEHLANTPRQLMIYEALGESVPEFAHVPLILNRDRTKMSKREGEASVAVGDWRRAGYVADGLLSYLALLGFHPGDDREILTRAELMEAFTLDRVGKSGSVFDPDKLRWVNAHVLHHAGGAQLLNWMRAARAIEGDRLGWFDGFETLSASHRSDESRCALLEIIRGNISTLEDVPRELSFLVGGEWEPEAQAVLVDPRAREVCGAMAEELRSLAEWSPEAFKSALLRVGEREKVKGKGLFQPIRAALTRKLHGPELPLVATVLDREQCRARLEAAAAGGLN